MGLYQQCVATTNGLLRWHAREGRPMKHQGVFSALGPKSRARPRTSIVVPIGNQHLACRDVQGGVEIQGAPFRQAVWAAARHGLQGSRNLCLSCNEQNQLSEYSCCLCARNVDRLHGLAKKAAVLLLVTFLPKKLGTEE